jgi:Metallo-peptidase family M12B Reprolysin-like/Secretion system C-terminal sorting domain
MKKTILPYSCLFFLLTLFFSKQSIGQNLKLWTPSAATENIVPKAGFQWNNVKTVNFPRQALFQALQNAPKEATGFRNEDSQLIVELPLPTGESVSYRMIETNFLSRETAEAFPSIKTYRGEEIGNPSNTVHATLSPLGWNMMLLRGKETVYIRPYELNGSDLHIVFSSKDETVPQGISCGVEAAEMNEAIRDIKSSFRGVSDCQRRTYRVAVAATGEYVVWAGSQANAAVQITATMNNVKAIYERDATITFTLVLNNAILFTDPATDPYTIVGTSGTTLATNHTTITNAIGTANFDLGHLFSNEWNGGLASTPSVCNSGSKGNAQSGIIFGSGPTGIAMENTVAHEIAHQFSVSHTMSSMAGSCSGNTALATAVETGGGSTIMAYAGVCTGNWYQNPSDQYFHTTSMTQLTAYAISQTTCGAITSSGNTPPALTMAATSYTIPVSTPFYVSATGSDVNGDALTYTFEQTDAILAATTSTPSATATNGPNFRSYPPNSPNFRSFPSASDIANNISPTYEVLPSVAKVMTFRTVVRDNRASGGCNAEVSWSVTTAGSAAFQVTSQSSATSLVSNGSNTFTVTWDVSGTSGAPVNCANVKILFSTDGGLTFPNVLTASTANDGSETIIIPNLPTSVGRVRVEAVGNIFFDINNANITITSSSGCAAEAASVAPTTAVVAIAGAGTLNLGLSPQYGTAITSFVGTLASTDPATNTSGNNAGACNYFNSTNYDSYSFVVNTATTYTFTMSAGTWGTVLNLYTGGYSSAAPCTNWLASSAVKSGANYGLNSVVSASLVPGVTYTLVVTGFNGSLPALPSSYTITPSGGGVYNSTPPPSASYNYAYVVVNTATSNVTAIQATSDLSNSGTFPAGTYSVYGLSYQNTTSLASLQSTYNSGVFSNLQSAILNSTFCGDLSSNSVAVTINCASAPTITIGNNNGLVLGCNPTTTTLTASGASTYVWSTSATSTGITVSSAGTYQVTGTDGGGCKGIANVNVTFSNVAPTISISSNNGLALGCAVPSTTLTASGGNTYAWTGGTSGSTKTVSSAGTYTVTGTNSYGCSSTALVGIYISNAAGATVSPSTAVSAAMGNASLDLTLAPQYAAVMTVPISATLASTDPAGTLAVVNVTAPTCANFGGNITNYQTYSFQVNIGGTYTFSKGNNNLVINLYNGSYNAASPCTNLINSGSIYNGASVSIGSSVSATLSPGVTYVLLISSFASGSPALPFAYSVSVTAPAGGAIYNTGTSINPGASYNYTYVIVKGGTIAAINASADLSGLTTAGAYTVYGLSYHNSISSGTLNGYISGSLTALQTAIGNSSFCGSLSTNTVAVTITCAPATATITNNNGLGLTCTNPNTTLTASAGSSYLWNNNATSNAITVTTAGTFAVTVTGADGCGATATVTTTLDNSAASITITNPPAVCTPATVNITTPAVLGTTPMGMTFAYSSFPNMASTLSSPSAIASSGTYYVQGTLGSCQTAVKTVVVVVKSTSLSMTGVSSLTPGCEENGFTYYTSGNNVYFGIAWGSDPGNAAAKAAATVSISVSNPGTGTAGQPWSATSGAQGWFVMGRYWDVNLNGETFTQPVSVRFLFSPTEVLAVGNAANTFAAGAGTVTGFTWFKTNNGTPFNPGTHLTTGGLSNSFIITNSNTTNAPWGGLNYAQFDGLTGFSGGTAAIAVNSASILPVQLTRFEGKKQGEQVKLTWATASEWNSKAFILEKSLDGIHFKAIATIAAAGTSKAEHFYTHFDPTPNNGYNYYRLITIDNDGTSHYEDKKVIVNVVRNTSLSLFPNPTNSDLTLTIDLDDDTNIQANILNMDGKIVRSFDYTFVKGTNQQTLDLHELPSGTYSLQLLKDSKEQVEIRRFVKLAK